MGQNHFKWSNKQLREHVEVLDGTRSPHILLKNATYLNSYMREWMTAHIWIYNDRIVYVGEQLPKQLTECEVVDCEGKYVVPGYIEPHAHPYQLYNPETLANHAMQFGTTTFINDNLTLFFTLKREEAFRLLDEFNKIPASMYWWCRFDGQTELQNGESLFNSEEIVEWLQHEAVIQGGELTAWPKLLHGDDEMLHWVQETKRLHKKVEGHFPGASETTLAKLKLLGTDCDHEAMTGQEAFARLMQGYTVSLRNSSIRPDLEVLLKELLELGVKQFDRFILTTDGSHPSFYANGMTNVMISTAIKQGVPVIDAYHMASYNIARYYNMEHVHSSIATGRIANVNILESKENPVPTSVIAKGQWVKRDRVNKNESLLIEWSNFKVTPLLLDWTIEKEDMVFSNKAGIHLLNNVITKPYVSEIDLGLNELSIVHDECFLMMIARDGSWRVNTVVKGFANELGGLASSYSGTGDIILIGKSKEDMLTAFHRVKELGGGIVIAEKNEVLHEIALPLLGIMSDVKMSELIQEEKKMVNLLQARGYAYNDPAFTILFFSATHLPFIRVTPIGLYDVKSSKVVAPPVNLIKQY
ncbi:adenine deaminase C-terminal domain-containing protein [Bacillus thuringiensis]|jgi:adenine deaminase|uniref:adenine deaminase n=3 Tax=Bacillus thuringiensis TaxID=1428 RepID=A0AB35PLX3_BACTU|nr:MULTISPECIES: adenine deaminase C-terminal domain-containing protein [Bacillus]MED1156076.1 adenine deaminase C-terminal domain-containing protein [Bacillus paranthracis]AFQ26703.1 adenine deaminase [Bacillus thuringiensis HD-789]AJH05641.1 putative adenine deaminase YerA [Bacillus thuringiensis HD1002]AND24813.1 adenosine deaminase [Bacillus thuringiensis serovar israelensis]EXL38579.1 adenine deaminase [Bacillus thuringiensis serovar israelensis]